MLLVLSPAEARDWPRVEREKRAGGRGGGRPGDAGVQVDCQQKIDLTQSILGAPSRMPQGPRSLLLGLKGPHISE